MPVGQRAEVEDRRDADPSPIGQGRGRKVVRVDAVGDHRDPIARHAETDQKGARHARGTDDGIAQRERCQFLFADFRQQIAAAQGWIVIFQLDAGQAVDFEQRLIAEARFVLRQRQAAPDRSIVDDVVGRRAGNVIHDGVAKLDRVGQEVPIGWRRNADHAARLHKCRSRAVVHRRA